MHQSRNKISYLDIFLNDKSIRGVLGQSFTLPSKLNLKTKLICALLCYYSLIVNTGYQANLQSLLTHPPKDTTMKTFKDLEDVDFKISLSRLEFNMFTLNRTIKKLLRFEETYRDFVKLRESMNTSYAYPVSRTRWQVFHERQMTYENNVFYYADNMCFLKFIDLSIPARKYLPYRNVFAEHIQRLHASGLINYWTSFNFYDMVRQNLTSLEDISEPVKWAQPLGWYDLIKV
ncbi:uncharacterized protein LOC119688749 [Teleopsis dalmanni]|uniref:uncharacterized protein LOC119664269 n=1 Tax=Teleopsis dalmanni TaxID=139649 RepID=UPI0018CE406F|nr:uncharacterized protein LOC119664269 [Teleopsis dalmanni]XP_037941264.1 uncharacterized protein LOC119674209 [Teleopsis dalmanni]XP_037959344.1 uncharacterized protein LOC119688749 [Teleopsis dalmanni]